MKIIEWKIHLNSSPGIVYQYLATSAGRERFWAEKAPEKNGFIHFEFPNGMRYTSAILFAEAGKSFHLDYFNSVVKFNLEHTENQGTDLTLINEGISSEDFAEVNAGWVSVLLNLKAAADFRCDLRNHDPARTWDDKYADN